MVLVVYKGSYILVSDPFLFQNGSISIYVLVSSQFFPNGNYISLVWELYIFDINQYYLEMTPAEFCIAKYCIVIF
jgi:hypothetical protein